MIGLAFLAQAANPGGLWDDILNFLTDFDKMFPGFREVVLQAQLPFFLVAFTMIVYHTIKRLSAPGSSSGRNLRAIGSAVVFTLAVALCNKLLDQVDQIFIAISTELGNSSQTPQVIEQKKEELIYALERDVERQNSGASGGGGESRGFIYYLRNPGEAVNQGVESIVPDFGGIVVEFVSFFLVLYMKIASLIAWGFWLIQQFLYAFSLIFLPAMIAAISIGALSSIGTRYVMSVVGLLSWPLGWALINVGTEAMLTSVVETVKTNSTGWDLTTYLWAIAICSIIPLWIILGYAFVPFVIQRMVTTGANAAAGVIGQVGGSALTAGAGFAAGSAFTGGGAGQAGSATAGSSAAPPASSGGGASGGNPQTSAANSVSGGGFTAGQSMANAPVSDTSDSFQSPSESFGETPSPDAGGNSSGQGTGTGDGLRAAAGGAMMAGASGFNTLAQDSGHTPAASPSQGGGSAGSGARGRGGESPMRDRIARSQSSQDHSLDPAFGNLAPSSAAARRTIESRRG